MKRRILGIGVDAVEVARVRAVAARTPGVLARLFDASEAEIARTFRADPPEDGWAALFCLKEAALKALGTGWGHGIGWRDLHVSIRRGGRVRIAPRGPALDRMRQMGGREFLARVTIGGGVALAACLLVAGEAPGRGRSIP